VSRRITFVEFVNLAGGFCAGGDDEDEGDRIGPVGDPVADGLRIDDAVGYSVGFSVVVALSLAGFSIARARFTVAVALPAAWGPGRTGGRIWGRRA
jgi:hypothetical protein